MGTVSSSLNPGVADLLQTLTNVNSPVANSQSLVSALESAPASDIVQLSSLATQLQGVDALFGLSTPPTSSNISSVLQALENTATGSTSTSGASNSSVLANASPTDQAANADAAIQAELTQGLFGTGTNNSLPGSLLNTLA
jgi:hypothetical protein